MTQCVLCLQLASALHFHPVLVRVGSFPLYGPVVSRWVAVPQFVYPVSGTGAFGLLPVCGHYEKCCFKHFCTNAFLSSLLLLLHLLLLLLLLSLRLLSLTGP